MVYDYKDWVVYLTIGMAFREADYKVHYHIDSRFLGDWQGLKQTIIRIACRLSSPTHMAVSNVLLYCLSHARPVVMATCYIQHFLPI